MTDWQITKDSFRRNFGRPLRAVRRRVWNRWDVLRYEITKRRRARARRRMRETYCAQGIHLAEVREDWALEFGQHQAVSRAYLNDPGMMEAARHQLESDLGPYAPWVRNQEITGPHEEHGDYFIRGLVLMVARVRTTRHVRRVLCAVCDAFLYAEGA